MEEITPIPQLIKKKRKTSSRIFMIISLILIGMIGYFVCDIFLSPDRNTQQIYLIPKDAAIIIQTNDPVNDWKKFSKSEPWICLKKAPAFAEVSASVATLDSILHENDQLLSFVGKREMMISLHKTRPNDWDFLIVVDLQKVSKIGLLKDQIEQVYKMMDYSVTTRKHNGINISEARDNETRDILYTAFIDNHLVVSYTSKLVEAAIDEREKPQIGLDPAFIEIEKTVANKGLSRFYVNYAQLPAFLSIYMSDNEYVSALCASMDYAGLYFVPEKDKFDLVGNMTLKEKPDPYVAALLNSGNNKMRAHEILSSRTAFYANIGFENPITFVKELEKALSTTDKTAYDSYVSNRQRLEKYFGISMEEHFLSWMAGEFAVTQAEPSLLGVEPETILAIRAKNITDAREKMDLIEKRIKKRSPINVKTITYNGFDIKYVEMKGFFRLFFGSLFDKFEKPYYTFVDDYVVFSNKSSSLLSFIADYEEGKLMKDSPGFRKAMGSSSEKSSIFVYADIQKFYPLMQKLVSRETWLDFQSHRDILFSFPEWTFQAVAERRNVGVQYIMHYAPYKPEVKKQEMVIEEDPETGEVIENISDSEEMNALKRFYVEEFEGNILRDFYESGALKSESEVKSGKRHGRFREFHENGKMKINGKYSNGLQKGLWRYYSEDGKLESKERF